MLSYHAISGEIEKSGLKNIPDGMIQFSGVKESQCMSSVCVCVCVCVCVYVCVCVLGDMREVYIYILKSRIIYIKLLTVVTLEDWD